MLCVDIGNANSPRLVNKKGWETVSRVVVFQSFKDPQMVIGLTSGSD